MERVSLYSRVLLALVMDKCPVAVDNWHGAVDRGGVLDGQEEPGSQNGQRYDQTCNHSDSDNQCLLSYTRHLHCYDNSYSDDQYDCLLSYINTWLLSYITCTATITRTVVSI